ncbi:MAG: KUP/HAK/KT family potassium transporter, partial [Aestuariivirga sp.]
MATAKVEEVSEAPDDPAIQVSGRKPPSFWILALGSIGVVYGDIGTSPLYAIREAVLAATNKTGPITEPIVFGVLSLVIWALILVVTVKYVFILLNADNKGEGGTLSLMALAQRVMGTKIVLIPVLAMIGAALFYGDALITPAISVLSAVEGLKIITPALDPYVLPITLAIIVGLFAVQSRGTANVAALFGPVTLVWFAAIALAGLARIGDNPAVLLSFNPVYA